MSKSRFENQVASFPMERASEMIPGAMTGQSLATDIQSFIAYARSFPFTLQGAQAKFGFNIFDLMVNEDGCVSGSVRKLKQETLSKKFKVLIPGGNESRSEIKAIEYVERSIAGMSVRLEDVCWQLLDYFVYGHRLAEVDWRPGEGLDAGKDVIDSVRIIPSNLYTIVLDAYGRFLGVIGRQPGRVPFTWVGPILMDLWSIPGFVPYWKLMLLSHSPKAGDARGTSRLDQAYNAYRLKKENWANWYDYLRNFGRPKVLVSLGETASAKDPLKTAEQEWTERIAESDYDVIGIPKGSTVSFQQFPDGWQPYVETLNTCNKEIALAILGSSRSILEAEHGSKADSGVSQDNVDEDTDYLGQQMCAAFTSQVIANLVKANCGPNVRCPVLTISEDVDDYVAYGTVGANLEKSGAIKTPSEHLQNMRKMGFDPPTDEEQAVLDDHFKRTGTNQTTEQVKGDDTASSTEDENKDESPKKVAA